MSNATEGGWYTMMGLSKIILRNFIIGCFLLCITTIATLATLLNKINQERLRDERDHRNELLISNQRCAESYQKQHGEYIKLLRDALETQGKIDLELQEWKQHYQKK